MQVQLEIWGKTAIIDDCRIFNSTESYRDAHILQSEFIEQEEYLYPWVARYAKEYCFPGWYIDTNGCYGCLLSKYWISVFVNDYDKTLDITADTIGESGYLDKNLELETAEDDAALAAIARRLMSQYAEKC